MTNRKSLLLLLLLLLCGRPGEAAAFPQITDPDNSDTAPEAADYFAVLNDRSPAARADDAPALTYHIRPGDTLYRVSAEFGLSVDDLLAVNSSLNPARLQVGQGIRIPSGPAEIPSLRNQTVREVLSAKLTAYTAGYESTGKRPSDPSYGITYSGSRVKEGRTIAVDPSVIPLGSTVYIENIGIRQAEDTGSAIKGKRVDIYMNDLQEALHFGVKPNVKVYVLSEGSRL
ncbi:3D domain-containing protein [Paenibacillus aurantius]|uniref:3D domain-containing protein n=1 Tax=Paenibacillus aurantius TaxID=2918900 RepID=A0AA96LFM6_9BACL|nr:3D domain-containing protein [Paenibacillus aurantius]WNQ12383.1 3D domain-containing protein [Paenibacillus aurantius]